MTWLRAKKVHGLSPRVRGNRSWSIKRRTPYCGSIPACAGEPWCTPSSSLPLEGSIPACAGEPRCRTFCSSLPVYPRVCGGTSSRNEDDDSTMTVYPRVCGGTVSRPMSRLGRECSMESGSIPACAGEPRRMVSSSAIGTAVGSIPACAGEPETESIDRPKIVRSIPACAGEPRRSKEGCRLQPGLRSIPACAGEPQSVLVRGSMKGSIPACAGEPMTCEGPTGR